jgi:hypothetical protein
MIKDSNNAEAASPEEAAADISEEAKGSAAEGSLAPHALSGDEQLAPEDLAVLPGHGQGGFGKRLVPAAAVLAVLALGVYSLTGGDGAEPLPPQPAAAAKPAPPAVAGKAVMESPASTTAQAPDAPSDEKPTTSQRGIPMMMQPPAADVSEELADDGPNGPSVGRFPDLPPSVISYLKRVEGLAGKGESAPANVEPAPTDGAPTP